MKNKSQMKSIIILVIVVFVLLALVTIPSLITQNIQEEQEYFPSYEKIEVKTIKENDTSSSNYVSLKTKLEKDSMFAKEMILENYSYNSFDGSNLRMLIKNYIFAYQLTNTKYLSIIDDDLGVFCMNQKYVIESFKELYNIDITEKLQYFPGYYEYVSKSSGRYCFNYKEILKEYNERVIVGIEEMTSRNGVVKANIYVYEIHSNNSSYINNAKAYISKNDFKSASNIVTNQLNGFVTRKQVQFRVNNSAKFYKYQILSMKILDN